MMRIVADTNWLVATYFVKLSQPRTDIVRRFSQQYDGPWLIPAPALLEAKTVFAGYTRETNSLEWRKLTADLGDKLSVPRFSWDEIATKAEELADRFAHKARLGTFDLMIVATAIKADATHFLSFDSNSNTRALAATLKLKVYPELTAEDRQRMAALR